MRFFIILIIFISLNQSGIAQGQSKFDFFLGYGYYQGYNIGSEYFLNPDKNSVSLSIGIDKLAKRNQESGSLTLGYNFPIFKKLKNDSEEFSWHMNNNLILWQLEDDYYLWRAISLLPSVNRKFIIYRNLKMSFDFGPSFNIVLLNKRKTYREVGWPYHVMPNFRILFIL